MDNTFVVLKQSFLSELRDQVFAELPILITANTYIHMIIIPSEYKIRSTTNILDDPSFQNYGIKSTNILDDPSFWNYEIKSTYINI